jgi:hypothetical protein
LHDDNKARIYWWLSRLLLERVTEYCESLVPEDRRTQDKLRIVFSRRGGSLEIQRLVRFAWLAQEAEERCGHSSRLIQYLIGFQKDRREAVFLFYGGVGSNLETSNASS